MPGSDLGVLTVDHAAQPREEALGEVGVHAVAAAGIGMIDAGDVECWLEEIPVRHLVDREHRSRRDPLSGNVHALGFAQKGPRERAVAALAQRDDDPPLAAAVRQQAAMTRSSRALAGRT